MNNSDTIITTSVENITMSSQFLKLTTPNGELEIDIKKLLKEPVNSDSAYFNATTIAKMYGVRPNDIFRSKDWKKYQSEMEAQVNSKYNQNAVIGMVKTVRGKHHGGTWLHSKMIVAFIRKLDVKLAVAMDLFIQDLIIHSNELKIERVNTKALFHPLTDTIKNYYILNQQSDNAKKFAYSSLLTMINMIVLGSTSKKYATENGIDIEKGKTIRDYLGQDKLEKIKKLEEHLNGLILYGKIYKYDTLKEELIKFN